MEIGANLGYIIVFVLVCGVVFYGYKKFIAKR